MSKDEFGRFMKRYKSDQRIGIMTLIEKVDKKFWLVKCDCGSEIKVSSQHLYRKKSCGCKSKSNMFKNSPRFDVQINIKYNHYKSGANRRSLKFDLSKKEFTNLVMSNCNYCKLPPHKEQRYRDNIQLFNGIDRVDTNKDYNIDNCVPCCSWCNFAKSDRPLNEYLEWLKWVKNNV
jgi:hypothetical protein